MGGRGSGSGMASVGASGAVSIPTNAQIDKMGFKVSRAYSAPWEEDRKLYKLNIDGVGGVTIVPNYDRTYSVHDNNFNNVGEFRHLNEAKTASKSYLKRIAAERRGGEQ